MSTQSDLQVTPKRNKSKLDDISREELIILLKKQSDTVRQTRNELEILKTEKDAAEERALNAEGKLLTLSILRSTDENSELKSDSPDSHVMITSMEARLKESQEKINNFLVMKQRLSEDLEASIIMNGELRSQVEDLKEEVIVLRQRHSQTEVAGLEMADYEKKLTELNKQLRKKSNELLEMQAVRDDMRAVCAETSQKLKVRNADFEAKIVELCSLEQKVHDLTLENRSLRNSSNKIGKELESAESARKFEIENLSTSLSKEIQNNGQLQTLLRSMEYSLEDLKTKKESAELKANNLEKDFESFKTRAKYVLEQHQNKEDIVPSTVTSDEISLRNQIEELEKTLKTLRKDMSTRDTELLQMRVDVTRVENEKFSAEREVEELRLDLALRMDQLRDYRFEKEKLLSDKENEQLLYRELLEAEQTKAHILENKCNTLADELATLEGELKFKSQFLHEERKKCCELENTIESLRSVAQKEPITSNSPSCTRRIGRPDEELECWVDGIFEDAPVEPPEASLRDVILGRNHGNETHLKGISLSTSEPVMDMTMLKAQYLHLQNVLLECEENSFRIEEQNNFLKQELRRLMNNEERIKHLENVEYVKNIMLKFVSPEKVSGERAHLIPILRTLLKLNKEETEILWSAVDTESSRITSATLGILHTWAGLA